MKNFIKIFLSDYRNKCVGIYSKEFSEDFPFATALQYAKEILFTNPKLWIGKMTYLGSDLENNNDCVYMFHCYARCDETKRVKKSSIQLYEKYKHRITWKEKSPDDVLQEKLSLDDLILLTKLPQGFSPDNINGNGFYKYENNIPTGCFNFNESMKFIGLNVYETGKPRGNHYHFLKVEYTYVLSGTIEAELTMIEHQLHEPETKKITLNAGDLILFLPGFNHKLTAISKTALAFEVCPQRFNPNDTYRL